MSIASKNLYELLGNDADQDPELREPEPPTKAIDKPVARTGKRNGPAEPALRSTGSSASTPRGPKDTGNANDNAFRDRDAGHDKNRNRGSGVPGDTGYRGGRGRGRGGGRGRGDRRHLAGEDRHSKTGIADHEKQAAHGWGGNDGNAELADEQAGEAIAQQDEKEAVTEDAQAELAEPEPEDKTKSYAAYLAEQAEKKLSLSAQNVRKANEGSSKKFPEGTAISREEDEDAYIAGSGGKSKRERERKTKNVVELDGDRMLQQAPRDNFRGRGRGRGDFRGGEGRGRGGRGRGEGRGEGRGRGEGGRGRGGPRGGDSSSPNVSDTSAFPSLGA